MNLKHLILSTTVFLLLLAACRIRYIPSRYPIPAKKLWNQVGTYSHQYGHIPDRVDTVITIKNLQRRYVKGELKEIGPFQYGRRKGYWIVYRNNLRTAEWIIHYDQNKVDSFFSPFEIH